MRNKFVNKFNPSFLLIELLVALALFISLFSVVVRLQRDSLSLLNAGKVRLFELDCTIKKMENGIVSESPRQ